ncbi:RNA polymerase sigma factor [Parabacteroides sp. Marseille-P3160]|uniref:RNA polymerase sigma factor n=1 Tax=Parabacteroides sp. Marseille-P3160 TaxID=1917887 RepID=UPI0009BAE2CD|nr:sigma-70 family RNA polymerase sigma factor [Parabacteroides sp. Marseille-P3160]
MFESLDENIWKSCLKGDRKAFEELYKRYYSLIYNYGCKFTVNRDLVKESIQNLFIKMITNHQSLSETHYVKGYLIKAFRNILYDTLSREQLREAQHISSDEFLLFEKELLLFPDESLLTDNMIKMRSAFLELLPRQQEILYLYYIMEMSHTDIAKALNIGHQSSKNLLSRSLIKLREYFFEKKRKDELRSARLENDFCYSEFSDSLSWFHLVMQKNPKIKTG